MLEHGPIILEMDTYRYHGHSMSDPGSTYRTRDEISNMRQLRDPVEHVRKMLLEKAGADPTELKKIEKVCLLGLQVLSPPVCQKPLYNSCKRSCVRVKQGPGHPFVLSMWLWTVQALMPVLEATLLLGKGLLMDFTFDWHT